MKKFFVQLSVLLLPLFLIFSCTNDLPIAKEKKSENTDYCDYTIIGELHNQGLNSIKEVFLQGENWTESELLETLEPHFLKRVEYVNSFMKPPHWKLKKEEALFIFSTVEENIEKIFDRDIAHLKTLLVGLGATEKEFKTLLGLSDVLHREDLTNQERLAAITEMENELINSGQMTYVVEEPLNIMKASLCYWPQNRAEWQEIDLRKDSGAEGRGFWDTINRMTEADFWSGAVGAVVGDGPGAVSGACYGSAAAGIRDLVTGACC